MTDHLLVTPRQSETLTPHQTPLQSNPTNSNPNLEKKISIFFLPSPIDGTRCKFEIARWRPNFERKNRFFPPLWIRELEERKEGRRRRWNFYLGDKNLTFLPSFLPWNPLDGVILERPLQEVASEGRNPIPVFLIEGKREGEGGRKGLVPRTFSGIREGIISTRQPRNLAWQSEPTLWFFNLIPSARPRTRDSCAAFSLDFLFPYFYPLSFSYGFYISFFLRYL